MSPSEQKTLRKSSILTESFFKARVADLIRNIQVRYELNDKELSELVSCSAETITNARNGDHKLSGHTLFNLLLVSETCLEGLLHFFDRRSVPLTAKCDTDPLVTTAAAVYRLAEASSGTGTLSDQQCLSVEDVLDAAIESLSSIKSRCFNIKEGRDQ